MSLRKVENEKTIRFVKNALLLIIIALLTSYILFSFGGFLLRSKKTLLGTEWRCWQGVALRFQENFCLRISPKDEEEVAYQERNGTVVLFASSGKQVDSLLRFGENRMFSSSTRSVFTFFCPKVGNEVRQGNEKKNSQTFIRLLQNACL